MSESLPSYLELPKGTTRQQFRLAQLMLTQDDDKSRAELMREAGYAPVTSLAVAKRTFGAVGLRRATEALTAGQRDRAPGIKAKAAAVVEAELDRKDADSGYALNAWATASKIAAEYPDSGSDVVSMAERHAARLSVLKYARIAAAVAVRRFALKHGIPPPTVTPSE